MRILSFLLLFILGSGLPHAAIYKEIGPDGTVRYTDSPSSPKAKELDPPPISTVPATPVNPQQNQPAQPAAPIGRYQSISIQRPGQDETLRDNAGDVEVEIALRPGLLSNEGHQIVVLLDGAVVHTGGDLDVLLKGVSRGSHTVTATIVDSQGATQITSTPVTFHLKQASILNRPTPPTVPRP